MLQAQTYGLRGKFIVSGSGLWKHIILSFLFVSIIFYYPLVVRYIVEYLYKFLFLFLLFLYLLLGVYLGVKKKLKIKVKVKRLLSNKIIFAFLFLYGCYLIILHLLTLFHFLFQHSYSLKPLIISDLNLIMGLSLFFFISWKQYKKTLNIYSDFFYYLSIIGIIMTILIAFGKLPPLQEIQIDTSGVGMDSGIRQFYGLGFGWMNIKFMGFTFPRLQSFASEAGNFAFSLLIASIWLIRKQRIKTWILPVSFAFVLTLSIGAFLTLLILIFLFVIREIFVFKRKKMFFSSIIFLSLVAIVYKIISHFGIFQNIKTLMNWYLATKLYFSSTGATSLGTRVEGIKATLTYFSEHVWGFGADLFSLYKIPLACGWIEVLAKVGPIGYFFYLFAFFLLLLKAINNIFFSKSYDKVALSFIFITLMIMAVQRTAIDRTLWNWWLIFAFLKCSNNIEESKNENTIT